MRVSSYQINSDGSTDKFIAPTSSAANYSLGANGNLSSDGLRSFDYDESNRLVKIKITKDGEAASVSGRLTLKSGFSV